LVCFLELNVHFHVIIIFLVTGDHYECEREIMTGTDNHSDYIDEPSNGSNTLKPPSVQTALKIMLGDMDWGLCNKDAFAPRVEHSFIDSLAIGSMAKRWMLCNLRRDLIDRIMDGPFEPCKPPWRSYNLQPGRYRRQFRNAVMVSQEVHQGDEKKVMAHAVANFENVDVVVIRYNETHPTACMYGRSGMCQQWNLDASVLRKVVDKLNIANVIVIVARGGWFVPIVPNRLINLATR
jgi:hypothetical protein